MYKSVITHYTYYDWTDITEMLIFLIMGIVLSGYTKVLYNIVSSKNKGGIPPPSGAYTMPCWSNYLHVVQGG